MRTQDAAGPGPVTAVSFLDLKQLAASLRSMAHELATPLTGLAPALGDGDLISAFERSEQDWHVQRQRLRQFFSETAGSVEQAVTSYQQTEDALARAARPGH